MFPRSRDVGGPPFQACRRRPQSLGLLDDAHFPVDEVLVVVALDHEPVERGVSSPARTSGLRSCADEIPKLPSLSPPSENPSTLIPLLPNGSAFNNSTQSCSSSTTESAQHSFVVLGVQGIHPSPCRLLRTAARLAVAPTSSQQERAYQRHGESPHRATVRPTSLASKLPVSQKRTVRFLGQLAPP